MDVELIVILVAVGLSILSGITKRKKNSQQHTGGEQHHDTSVDDEDPWSTIRKYIEGARGEADETEPAPQELKPQPVSAKAEDNPYTSTLNEYARNKSREQQSTARRDNNRKKDYSQIENSMEAAEAIADTQNLMDDFDLRKAVIYSEILKPKYKDF